MRQSDTVQRDNTEPKGGFLSRFSAAEITAYIGAGVAALVSTWLSIGDKFSSNMQGVKEFRSLKKELNRKLSNLSDTNFIQESVAAWREYNIAYKDACAKKGVYNTLDKWRSLKPHQKFQTGLTILTVFAVAGVAIYNIRQSRKLKAIAEEKEELEQQAKTAPPPVTQPEPVAAEKPMPKEEKIPPVAMGEKTTALLSARETAPLENFLS